MSTLRYCGEIRIRVTYVETSHYPTGQYRCFLRGPGDMSETIWVGAVIRHGSDIGVDSPESFDDAARASIAFADHEASMYLHGYPWSEHAAYAVDLSGVHVGRSPATAWPKSAQAGSS